VSVNMGSFGVILTRDQTVPDVAWTKIVFDKVEWDTVGRFDLRAGCFEAERDGKYYFMAGARLLVPRATWCSADLMLYKNGEPLRNLTPDAPLRKDCYSVALNSRSTPQALLTRGFTTHEVIAATGDIFEVYIRHDCGEHAHLSQRHADAADGTKLQERQPTYCIGVWHV
jgi:hypothetical protein